jgi:hypothetical protein
MKDIIKNYEHINRSFGNWDTPNGKYISSKKQYQEEMAKGGFKPYDGSGSPQQKKWTPSEDLHRTLHEVKNMADKKGRIDIATNTRLVEKMKSMGMSFNPKFMTNDLKGGIDASR